MLRTIFMGDSFGECAVRQFFTVILIGQSLNSSLLGNFPYVSRADFCNYHRTLSSVSISITTDRQFMSLSYVELGSFALWISMKTDYFRHYSDYIPNLIYLAHFFHLTT